MRGETTILVLSDIHTTDKDPGAHASPSYVSTMGAGSKGGIDPVAQMIQTVAAEYGSVDFVVCPGDMTDQALPAGLVYIAERLRQATDQLTAKELVVVAGNHDVDSRFKHNEFDPRGHLMATFPAMPFSNGQHHLEFFAHHVTMKAIEGIRFLAIDSTAFHGGGAPKKADGSAEVPEYEHGRVSPLMLRRIRELLEKDSGEYAVNVLVCHHHPQNNNIVNEVDFSQMEGGPALLELLGSGSFGRWIVIHGHKHRPRLTYAAGGSTSPIILGAASFSAQIGGDALNRSPNQFHVLTIDPQLAQVLQCGLAGSVRSWSWIPGDGWKPAASQAEGLPAIAGFGFRGDPQSLAVQISSGITKPLEWNEALKEFPALGALLPRDFETLRQNLKKLGVNVLEERGIPTQIGKPA